MKYNFNEVVNRYGTSSLKFDFVRERGMPDDVLPMWVADMDFPAPPEVLEDIHSAVSHGIFGYTEAKESYYNAVINWFKSRFGNDLVGQGSTCFAYEVTRREIVKAPGIVFALAQAIRAFTEAGDAVLIQTPVYYPFYDIIRDNDRVLVTNPLVYSDGMYSIDFTDFERKIIENNVKLFLLCSPHNPVGRVWTKAELKQLNEICTRHNVIVISDEIHCDFVWSGHAHTCFGIINKNAVIATAPSKTFNLAGLQISNLFVKDTDLRRKLKSEINKSGYSQLNTLGIIACESAYTKGAEWLHELKVYLEGNIKLVREFVAERLPKVKMTPPQSTYLVWLDFAEYGLSQEELDKRITDGAKLWLDGGTMFGKEGKGFQRVNIACPRSVLQDALDRLKGEFS
ncbi:MAG: pyridoxal phosphate-dependent aminotransferase [Oscillospiraceae bacterium]|nr:pyridoxal phosphate-dependent aminotransferase [Oscillospiraceae bacterium]